MTTEAVTLRHQEPGDDPDERITIEYEDHAFPTALRRVLPPKENSDFISLWFLRVGDSSVFASQGREDYNTAKRKPRYKDALRIG